MIRSHPRHGTHSSMRCPWSVAPMMERTDVHFRTLMQHVAPGVRLYTEMAVASGALSELQPSKGPCPEAAQLAGADPGVVVQAARQAERRGFSQIDLNVGCPGAAASAGGWGAAAMAHPERVRAIVAALVDAVSVPVSVKCRLSIRPRAEPEAQYDDLLGFVDAIAAAGCRHVIVHARAAHLHGLSPRANRSVPPLRHALVHRLATERPDVRVEINGGITTAEQARAHLPHTAGVMIGRAAYDDPFLLAELVHGHRPALSGIVEAMASYVDAERRRGTPPWAVLRHLMSLTRGRPGGKASRIALAGLRTDPTADGRAVRQAFAPLTAAAKNASSHPPAARAIGFALR